MTMPRPTAQINVNDTINSKLTTMTNLCYTSACSKPAYLAVPPSRSNKPKKVIYLIFSIDVFIPGLN